MPAGRIDRVIVETTGLADPVPVLQAIIANPPVAARFEAATLLTMVDALNLPRQLASHREARMQVSLADLLVVTKLDMVPADQREARRAEVVALLRALNPAAPIALRGEVPLSPALFDLAAPAAREIAQPPAHHHHHHDVNRHGDNIRSVVLRTDRPMPRGAAEMFCELMTSAHGDHLLRLKGLVAIEGEKGPLLVHAIHGVMHEPRQLANWPGEVPGTRLVVILDGLDPAFVERLFGGFANVALPDTPDRDALVANPLAIPGYRA